MPHEYRIGDKVKRTAAKGIAGVPRGDIGKVVGLYNGQHPTVDWACGSSFTYGYPGQDDCFSIDCLELISPAVEPAPATAPGQCGTCGFIGGNCCLACTTCPGNPQAQQRQQPGIYEVAQQMAAARVNAQPAAAVKVCSSKCDDTKLALEKAQAQLAEATGAKLRVGDIMGENEHLRSRVAELEAALGFAERELCRMKQRGGRR